MIRVNLLKADKREHERRALTPEAEHKEAKKKGPNTNLIILGAIVALAGLALLQKRALDRESALRAAAQDEQAALAPVIAKLAEVEQSKTFLEKKVSFIQFLRMQQAQPVLILEEMSKCLPDWVWLSEATLRNRLLEIKGRALSNVQISDYMDGLMKTSLFEAVNLVSSQQRATGPNTYLEFTINATFPPIEPTSSTTPEPGRKRP